MLPLHQLDVGFIFNNDENSFSVTSHFQSLRYIKISNAAYMPAVFTMDLFYRRKLAEYLNIYFRLDNIFNTQYESAAGYPMPGTSLSIGLELEL